MAALDTLKADVLQGRAVANETAAALLPLIANADPFSAVLETSGALKRLAQGDSVQVSPAVNPPLRSRGGGQPSLCCLELPSSMLFAVASHQTADLS
jgi:hypothetical protein